MLCKKIFAYQLYFTTKIKLIIREPVHQYDPFPKLRHKNKMASIVYRGTLIFLSIGAYGDSGYFTIKKKDIKLQPTGMVITHHNNKGKRFSDNFRTKKTLLFLKLIYNYTCLLELDIFFLHRKITDRKITDQNFYLHI